MLLGITRSYIIWAILFLVIIIPVFSASAQTTPNLNGGLTITPSLISPQPGQKVTITAQSYVVDLKGSTIIWTAGGKEISRGIGQTTATVVAPALGKSMTVSAVAITPDNQRLSTSITVGSGDIDLIIETNGYVPPFFKGKVQPMYQNTIRIVAIPHLADASGKEYPANSLVYSWKKDWKELPNDSGYGRQALSITSDLVPRPFDITVSVATRDGKSQAEKFVSVEPGKPFISFYEEDPLYGTLYNRALPGSVSVRGDKEVSVMAVPYGFNNQGSNLSYSWLINGQEHTELNNKQSVVLRAPASSEGTSRLSLTVQNLTDILQGNTGALDVFFTQKKAAASQVVF